MSKFVLMIGLTSIERQNVEQFTSDDTLLSIFGFSSRFIELDYETEFQDFRSNARIHQTSRETKVALLHLELREIR